VKQNAYAEQESLPSLRKFGDGSFAQAWKRRTVPFESHWSTALPLFGLRRPLLCLLMARRWYLGDGPSRLAGATEQRNLSLRHGTWLRTERDLEFEGEFQVPERIAFCRRPISAYG